MNSNMLSILISVYRHKQVSYIAGNFYGMLILEWTWQSRKFPPTKINVSTATVICKWILSRLRARPNALQSLTNCSQC